MDILNFDNKDIIKYNFPLSTVCTMKTGGNAKYAFFPENKQQLSDIIVFLKNNNIKFKMLGNGSNTVFKDEGYNGAVILTQNMKSVFDVTDDGMSVFFENCEQDERKIFVEAGYSLTSLASKMCRCGYTGLEFAYGIPASVGGAVFMNAGAYGGEMKDVIYSVEYFDSDGTLKLLYNNEDSDYFSYRHSYFSDNTDCIITGVTLKLKKSINQDPMEVAERNMRSRKEKQPLEYPSCGSAFKRPVGNFAGALIEKAGLKGTNVGGAYVSEKHAGFIVNKGGATTSDITNLIELVKKTVYETSGVMLEPEIRVVED